jgi:hypothetical protein
MFNLTPKRVLFNSKENLFIEPSLHRSASDLIYQNIQQTNEEKMASQHTYDSHSTKNAIPLRPVIKDYAWGIRGLDSRVARFALESGVIDEVDPDCPCK